MLKDKCVRIDANWTVLSIQQINKELYFQFTIVCEKHLPEDKIKEMETFKTVY